MMAMQQKKQKTSEKTKEIQTFISDVRAGKYTTISNLNANYGRVNQSALPYAQQQNRIIKYGLK